MVKLLWVFTLDIRISKYNSFIQVDEFLFILNIVKLFTIIHFNLIKNYNEILVMNDMDQCELCMIMPTGPLKY